MSKRLLKYSWWVSKLTECGHLLLPSLKLFRKSNMRMRKFDLVKTMKNGGVKEESKSKSEKQRHVCTKAQRTAGTLSRIQTSVCVYTYIGM